MYNESKTIEDYFFESFLGRRRRWLKSEGKKITQITKNTYFMSPCIVRSESQTIFFSSFCYIAVLTHSNVHTRNRSHVLFRWFLSKSFSPVCVRSLPNIRIKFFFVCIKYQSCIEIWDKSIGHWTLQFELLLWVNSDKILKKRDWNERATQIS